MQTSITRKFLVNKMPDLSVLEKKVYQRHYLYVSDYTVVRVQKVGDKYEIERKTNKNELVRESQRIEITEKEFTDLSKLSDKTTTRDSYRISTNPHMVLRIYHGKFEGLVRIEVNFSTKEEADKFIPLPWFGKEITRTPFSQDGYLLNLSKDEFRRLLKN